MTTLTHRSPYRNHRIDQGFGQRFTLNKQSNQAHKLIAWWTPLVSSGGSLLRDLSGVGNNGDFVASPAWTRDGERGMVLDFDGANDGVDVIPSVALDNVNTLTYSFWLYPQGWGVSSAGCVLMNIASGPNRTLKQIRLLNGSGEESIRVFINSDSTNGSSNAANSTIVLNTWQLITITFDVNGDKTIRIYKDGAETSYASQTAMTGTIDDDSAGQFIIGYEGFVGSRFFDGYIDDVRIYNRILSASEIMGLYAPSTRWQLYQPPKRTLAMKAVAAAGVPIFRRRIQGY